MIASTIFITLYCNISVKYTKKSTKPINKDMFIHIIRIINVMGGEMINRSMRLCVHVVQKPGE